MQYVLNREMPGAPFCALFAKDGWNGLKAVTRLQPVTQIANKHAGCNEVTAVTGFFH